MGYESLVQLTARQFGWTVCNTPITRTSQNMTLLQHSKRRLRNCNYKKYRENMFFWSSCILMLKIILDHFCAFSLGVQSRIYMTKHYALYKFIVGLNGPANKTTWGYEVWNVLLKLKNNIQTLVILQKLLHLAIQTRMLYNYKYWLVNPLNVKL